MVTGKVAELEAVPKAVKSALPILKMNRKGSFRTITPGKSDNFIS